MKSTQCIIRLLTVCAALVAMGGRGAWGETANQIPDDQGVSVNVLIYSGRPNPVWQITDSKEIEMIRRAIENLPQADKPEYWGLGFSGFRIINKSKNDLPKEIHAFLGVLGIRYNGQSTYYSDIHGLEKKLIDAAKKQAFTDNVNIAIDEYEAALLLLSRNVDLATCGAPDGVIDMALRICRVKGKSECLPAARSIARTSQSDRLRRSALALVGQYGDESDIQLFKDIDSKSPSVNASIVQASKKIEERRKGKGGTEKER